MTNILVTGASGFVGKNLLKYLDSKNYNITVYDRDKGIDNFNHFDVIIHLAGKAHDLLNVSKPQDYYDANFELTKKLYNQFIESNSKKFIFISSVKASADTVIGILTENDQTNPKTHYGKSKLFAENYIQSIELPESKYYYILRPCMIHGPGNKGNLNLLYKFVSKGIPWPLAGFDNQRSFLSIDNLCFVIKELIDRDDIQSDIYNVADDEPISTNELINIISQTLNLKPKLWRINNSLIRSIAKIGDKLGLPLNSERLKKLTESYVVSNEKLLKVIKKDMPYSTKEGLVSTIKSFK